MARKKPTKSPSPDKRPRGRPAEHAVGFTRSTLILPLDLLADLDRTLAGWIVKRGSPCKRSELIRACFRAIVEADRLGKLEDLAHAPTEPAMFEALKKKLAR